MLRKNRAAKRIVGILKAFLEKQHALGVTELSTILGACKSVVHEDLTALVDEKIVEKDYETGKYYIGSKLFELGAGLLKQKELRQHSIAIMEDISNVIKEGVTLITWVGSVPYCLESIDSPHPLKVSLAIGTSFPLHAGSAGKLLLAYLPDKEREEAMKKLKLTRYTERTITTLSELRRRLDDIREKGFVISRGERFKGVVSVGAPIFNRHGQVVACLCITMPSDRSNQKRVSECISIAIKGGRDISRRLGFQE